MLIGILSGLTTCALWGLTFVAPRVVAPFTAWDLTIARYGIFGLASLLLMVDRRFRPSGLKPGRLVVGFLLGGAGYVGYFVSAGFAVQLAGSAIPPVIIGTMPIFLTIIANMRDRSAPWSAIFFPLTIAAVGVAVVNVAAIFQADSSSTTEISLGILMSFCALVIWIIYALTNAAIMRSSAPPNALHWTGIQGIGAAVASLLLLPFASFDLVATASNYEVSRFLGWALVMGLAGSLLATWFWVIASRRLPLALSAQLIVAETLFGLAFGLSFEGRLPSLSETIGTALQVVGVCSAIAAFANLRLPASSAEPNRNNGKSRGTHDIATN